MECHVTTKPTILFCDERPAHKGGMYLTDFYPHPGQVRMCRSPQDMKNPILQVEVSEGMDTPGTYWAWWDEQDQAFQFVNANKMGVEICFAYGSRAEEERGKGKLLPVSIKILEKV